MRGFNSSSAPTNLVLINANRTLACVCHLIEEFLGYEPEGLTGKPLEILVDPQDLPAVIAYLVDAETPHSTSTQVVRLLKSTGEPVAWAMRFIRLGDQLGLTGTGTYSVREHRMVEEFDEGYQVLFEQHPRPMFVTDHENLTFLAANDSAVRQYGYSHEEFRSMKLADIRPPDEVEAMKNFVSGPDLNEDKVWTHIYKSGEKRLVRISRRRMMFGNLPVGLVAVVDVTDEVMAHNQIEEANKELLRLNASLEHRVTHRTAELMAANKELEAFCFSVSHDLRAPLRAIDGFTRAFVEDYGLQVDNEGLEILTRVRSATQKMSTLIDDLLGLARLSRKEMRCRSLDLTELCQEVSVEISSEPEQTRVKWLIAENMRVHADPALLRVVLVNLLGNAAKFSSTRNQAIVSVDAQSQGNCTIVQVMDNGVGFEMQYSDKLFKPFERLHRADQFSGNGIGLATVSRIIMRHGGSVGATCQLDEGSSMWFSLPNSPDAP